MALALSPSSNILGLNLLKHFLHSTSELSVYPSLPGCGKITEVIRLVKKKWLRDYSWKVELVLYENCPEKILLAVVHLHSNIVNTNTRKFYCHNIIVAKFCNIHSWWPFRTCISIASLNNCIKRNHSNQISCLNPILPKSAWLSKRPSLLLNSFNSFYQKNKTHSIVVICVFKTNTQK